MFMMTVVVPTDGVPRLTLSCCAVLIKIPGSLVGSAVSSLLVTVIAPVRVVAMAMLGEMNVLNPSAPAVSFAKSFDPVAWPLAHCT